jgi:hypothetical protein
MKRRQRAIGFICFTLAAALWCGAWACSKDPYTASMAASLDVSNGVNDGLTVLSELRKGNLITQAEVADYAGYLGSLTTLNGTFRTSVRQIHASGQTGKAAYLAAAQVFVSNANSPQVLTALHVSNPAAQAKVETFMRAIATAITGIQTAINAAKGA